MSVPIMTGQFAGPLAAKGALALAGGAKNAAEKLREVAEDFEATLTTELLQQMRSTLEPGGMFGQDGADIYGGLFDFFMGKHLAKAGGLGVAAYVQQQLGQPKG